MKINYKFKNPNLLTLALTHPSMSRQGITESYERLEFLGDSVIGLVIADMAYNSYPDITEGKLALIHSTLVRTNTLAEIATALSLDQHIRMDKGEERIGGRSNPKNLENALEALIGAIYLDGGFNAAKTFMEPLWLPYFNDNLTNISRDPKSELQEWAQKLGRPIPEYRVISQSGASHNPVFTIQLDVKKVKSVKATGSSKKEAQTLAASLMLAQIKSSSS